MFIKHYFGRNSATFQELNLRFVQLYLYIKYISYVFMTYSGNKFEITLTFGKYKFWFRNNVLWVISDTYEIEKYYIRCIIFAYFSGRFPEKGFIRTFLLGMIINLKPLLKIWNIPQRIILWSYLTRFWLIHQSKELMSEAEFFSIYSGINSRGSKFWVVIKISVHGDII